MTRIDSAARILHRSFTNAAYGKSRLKRGSLRLCCVGVEFALRKELRVQRMRRRMMLVAMVILGPVALGPRVASAENLFDLLFGGAQKQQQRQVPAQASFFAD